MDKETINEIFFSHSLAANERVKKDRMRFAYYTTAEVALSIIQDRKIWMRNTMTMNDYMEIDYGLRCLSNAFNSDPGSQLKAAINNCHAGLAEEVWKLTADWSPNFKFDTFITCLSEHDEQDDPFGRLSMWRAYGGKTGVALVVSGGAISLPPEALGV